MNETCMAFGVSSLTADVVQGKELLEIGSLNHNGSLRKHVERLGPARYLGIDIMSGPGVDEICEIGDLVSRYGKDRFDVVFTTEVLEHVRDWEGAVTNMKNVLKTGGVLVLTTRSLGFPYHAYPYDFWRYEIADMRALFSDFEILTLESDPMEPGVFLKAVKPMGFVERKPKGYRLYSMITRSKRTRVTGIEISFFMAKNRLRKLASQIIPGFAKPTLKRFFVAS
jgi:SAM-dependent methyltransferase